MDAQYITHEIPMATGAMSSFPYSEGLASACTFYSAFDEKPISMAVRIDNTLWIPRNIAPIGKLDARVEYTPQYLAYSFTPKHDEQEPCALQSIALLRSGQNHIVDAPTGWGKTVVGSLIAVRMGQPTLIIVTKNDLMSQWYDALTKVLKIPAAHVGHIQQDKCDYKGKRFVLAMVHSLIIPDKYPPEMLSYFGLLIFDEVHLMAAESFVRACQMFPAKYRVGFSATEKRKDGKSKLLYAHIGPVGVRGKNVPMSPKVLMKKTGWSIPRGRNGERLSVSPGRLGLILKPMANNLVRNNIIGEFTKAACDAGRRPLLVSDSLEHLSIIFHVLCAYGVPGEEIGYYVGGMKKHELDITKTKRVVLGTIKMVSTGTDVPHWDTLVPMTPRADVAQLVGRILRTMKGKKEPVVLDLVDYDKIFHNYYLSRCKYYASVGGKIVNL